MVSIIAYEHMERRKTAANKNILAEKINLLTWCALHLAELRRTVQRLACNRLFYALYDGTFLYFVDITGF